MPKPKPTKQLILELCGGNQGLISSFHHGLYETHLADFYQHLDLDEIAAFAPSSWKTRDKSPLFFEHFITPSTHIHDIFSQVYIVGFPWLNKHKEISDRLKPLYERLNPFKGKNLRERLERLERVNPRAVERLKERLKEMTNEYVFECQGIRNGAIAMKFQPYYPKKGKIVPTYASEIARMISEYPTNYVPLD